MEWFSCEEIIPPDKSNFLGSDGELIFAAYWCNDTESYKVGGWEGCHYCGGASPIGFFKDYYTTKKITYWMPLPALPNSNQAGQKKNSESGNGMDKR